MTVKFRGTRFAVGKRIADHITVKEVDSMSKTINVGFIGNPNCGKTTLFNAFTGANLKVANWPGVTVEKKKAIQLMRENSSNW